MKRPLASAALLCLTVLAPRLPAQVDLELHIPPAETYVIGDDIPLAWNFKNLGGQPLGFMWEGCCRLNGRLAVTQAGKALATVPPGQALAHMFARADRLDPDVPKAYDTKVSDWVKLPGTGTYHLQGTYRGVLPTQVPQVPRGLALWRDAAVSQPVALEVLAVADYLAQRDDRVHRRGLRLQFEAPIRVRPLVDMKFSVTVENLTDQPRHVRWPDDFALWVLDAQDQRTAAAVAISDPTEVVPIPARGRWAREFRIGAERFEGEPLADYRWFVDLAAANNDPPRVPSNLLPVSWRLDPVDTLDLVKVAAAGARTGARNAPLKLLRVYLLELATTLANLDRSALEPDARELAHRLSAAARLKPLSPQPGRVDVVLALPANGAARWAQSVVADVLDHPHQPLADQLEELLGLRRHLGWEVNLVLDPSGDTLVDRVLTTANEVSRHANELAGPPEARLPLVFTNAPARLLVTGDSVRTGQGPVLRLQASRLEWSEDGATFHPLTNPADLLKPGVSTSAPGRWQVAVNPSLPWTTVTNAVAPLLRPGATLLILGGKSSAG